MTPLLLLPGMMCDARLFAPQIAAFSATRAVHAAPIGGHDRMERIAAEVLAHAPPRFALAGLSMGGIVAMEIAAQAPDRIERIALLDTNPLAEAEAVRACRRPQIDKVQAGGLDAVMQEEMKPNYLAPGPRRTDILDLCLTMARTLGPEVFERQSVALMHRADRQAVLRRLNCPALVLCGADDIPCPPERHRLMADLIPAAVLTIVDGAGHLPVLEQPEVTNTALAAWLAA